MTMAPVVIMAVDPGAISGAIALFHEDGEIFVGDLAVVDGQLDAAALSRVVRDTRVSIAVVERVGAMPKQGIASTFKFGFACGVIRGILMAHCIPTHYVTPPIWKKHFNLIGKDKEASRELAIRMYPGLRGLERKKDQNRAEALLIGRWFTDTRVKT